MSALEAPFLVVAGDMPVSPVTISRICVKLLLEMKGGSPRRRSRVERESLRCSKGAKLKKSFELDRDSRDLAICAREGGEEKITGGC